MKTDDTSSSCPMCGKSQASNIIDWHYCCSACDVEYSTLAPAISRVDEIGCIEEGRRRVALEALRISNARQIVSELIRLGCKQDARILDVGCAYGWFLDVAKEAGFQADGVEPEQEIADFARSKGHEVLIGYYPDAVPSTASYNVIAFNDVLEHIPNPESIIRACRDRLPPGGFLSVAIPIRTGFFYRVSKLLFRLGVRSPFERMWQAKFHSPHITYFSQNSLTRLAERNGFNLLSSRRLDVLKRKGVWERLRYDSQMNAFKASIIWFMVQISLLFLKVLPSDTVHFVFVKNSESKEDL